MKLKISIVKIGGEIIENERELGLFLDLFAQLKGPKILVHGGGKSATKIGKKLGIESRLVDGRRITDARNLKVALMVYAGLISKSIVARLQAFNCDAIGLSGADGNLISAHKRPIKTIDFGFVGDIDTINNKAVFKLLDAGFVPVFCALTHDGNGQMLNTNADTIASELAIAMSKKYATTLYYCFDKKGVLQDIGDDESVIEQINNASYQELAQKKTISEGMLPKLENSFHALRGNVEKVCIGNLSMLKNHSQIYTTLRL